MSEALIIVDGRPNETLAQILESFGVADELGPGWPRADLDLSAGVAIRCDDWDDLCAQIEQRPRQRVLAFYAGPGGLESVDGAAVSHLGRNYQIRRVEPTRSILPYAHRLLSIERRGVTLEGASLDRSGVAGAGNLFFCPVAANVEVDELDAIGFAGLEVNAIMLPPVSTTQVNSYFEDALVTLRKELVRNVVGKLSFSWEPTALVLMSLVDHPVLRPFLMDGGCLKLGDEQDGPTRIVLEVAATDRLPAYRADFFEANGPAPTGLGAARAALRTDLMRLSPGLTMRRSREAHSWGEYELRGRLRTDHAVGSWQLIEALLGGLKAFMPVEFESRLRDRILDASAPRSGGNADHGLAEEAFVRDLARVPWAPDQPNWGIHSPLNTAWDEAVTNLCLGHLTSQVGAAPVGRTPWEAIGTGWEFAADRQPMTVYYPGQDASEVFRWRLHAPLGAVFLADECSRIGYEDTMRLGETLRLR